MNYKIIVNQEMLLNFVDYLPATKDDEVYYVALFARNKYCSTANIGQGQQQLKRFTSKKENLLTKIKQLEVQLGAFSLKNGEPIPQEAMALYIGINPRSLVKATKQGIRKLTDLVLESYSGYNPQNIILTEIVKAVSRKLYYDLDFDDMSLDEVIEYTSGKINRDALKVLRTRGGYHVLVELSKISQEYQRSWHKNLITPIVDKAGVDGLIPVPGCYQGGFVPHFVEVT